MAMRLVNVDNLRVGDKILKDIYSGSGLLLVPAGTVVNSIIIDKLQNIGTEQVYIDDEVNQIAEAQRQIFKLRYETCVADIRALMDEALTGKKLEPENVGEIVDNLNTSILNQPNIVIRMYELKSIDSYTYKHSVNVSVIASMIAKWMKYDQQSIKAVMTAGLMHDIGKCKVDSNILNKPYKLTDSEFNEMKKHSIYSYMMCKEIFKLPENICQAVLSHHERNDGSGYPQGLKSGSICEFAKILAVADVFDAITSDRIYKKGINHYSAAQVLHEESFKNLDPIIVNTFLSNITNYFVGNIVKLSNGETGEVIFINSTMPTRPVVKVNDTYYDLSRNFNINIMDVLA